MLKKCKICEKEFETIKFGGKRIYCFECNPQGSANSITLIRRKSKEAGVKKLGGKCIKCGNEKSYLMEFHHKDPAEKEGELSDFSKGYDLTKFFQELEKCVLLCANCHREFHWFNNLKKISLEEYLNGSVAEMD